MPWHLVSFNNPLHLIKAGFGDCRHKHDLLAKMFFVLDVPVKHLTMEYNWKNVPIPAKILNKLGSVSSIWPHYSLKALVNGKWIIVDATWDSALKKAGFPVNEWGKEMGFITKKVRNIREIGIREHIQKSVKLFEVVRHVNDYFLFAEVLNSYLEKIRKK